MHRKILPPSGRWTQWWVSPPTDLGRPNFLPKFRSDLKIRPGRTKSREAREFLADQFPPTRLAEQGHPRDQNCGDGARGRRFENVNFPWNVPIRVTLLATQCRPRSGTVRARRNFRDSAGGPNGEEKSRIAFGYRAPKFSSAIRRADSLVGPSHRPTRRPNFRPKFPSDRPTRPGRTETAGSSARLFGPPFFPTTWLAELGHPRDKNCGDSAPGRRCENVNFPRDVPIVVTRLADHRRSRAGRRERAQFGAIWSAGSTVRKKPTDRVRTPCTKMAFRHPARGPTGGPVWADRPPTAELPAKVPDQPEKSDRSDRNGRKFRVTFFGPPFSGHLAGGAGSSARPKFRGQCARSALRKCENSRGTSL